MTTCVSPVVGGGDSGGGGGDSGGSGVGVDGVASGGGNGGGGVCSGGGSCFLFSKREKEGRRGRERRGKTDVIEVSWQTVVD
ncbi:hypothetical protein HZU73_09400 [Apis mellifera caucasica]|nr:hypothetical protein HZU73_09400 [Apis mellifera caucasica]